MRRLEHVFRRRPPSHFRARVAHLSSCCFSPLLSSRYVILRNARVHHCAARDLKISELHQVKTREYVEWISFCFAAGCQSNSFLGGFGGLFQIWIWFFFDGYTYLSRKSSEVRLKSTNLAICSKSAISPFFVYESNTTLECRVLW